MIAKQKILIVDDDENIAELISLYLMKECFDTKIVSNGEDALSAFETYQPNLVLLDLPTVSPICGPTGTVGTRVNRAVGTQVDRDAGTRVNRGHRAIPPPDRSVTRAYPDSES